MSRWVDPAGFLAAYQQNGSCNPYTPRESPCLQGNYVNYAINVSSPKHAIAGVKFAQKKNVRLVIKNTGHEYGRPVFRQLVIHAELLQLPRKVYRSWCFEYMDT
jgi:hypothetical protein